MPTIYRKIIFRIKINRHRKRYQRKSENEIVSSIKTESERESQAEIEARVLKKLVRELAAKVPENLQLESISEEIESKHSPYDASYISSEAEESKSTHREASFNSGR